MKIIIFTFSFLVMSQMTLLSQEIYVVTKPYDVDPIIHQYHFVDSLCDQEMYGTYQWALRKVNDTPGPCIIQFAISGVGPQTLNILYELPGLTNPYSVAIDGTTQPGYQYGQPVIIIDGGNVLTIGITCYFGNNIEIKGIQIQNFYLYGILINDCNTGVIESNVVIGGPYIGILLYESFSFSVIGNYLGTNYFLDSGLGCDWMGIRIDNYYGSIASNHVIGGTGQNEGNTIAFNENYGIQVLYATNNLITRNRIFNNSWGGIALSFTANNAKICPFINSFVDTIITGTSQPNDIIEIFGSTGNQNANEYLTTVTANAGGEWSAVITNNNYANCIATATDALNNTSQLSNALMAEIPTTQLIASDCGATNVEFDQVLTAEIVIGADQYLFHVFNQSGFDEILTKSASAFSLNELTGQVEYNTTYSVEVRMIFQNDTSAWGNTCAITTVNLLPGQCCETAILIDQIPSDETYEFINSDELWLTFVADTSVLLIHIIEPDTFPVANVQNITLYKGDCNNLIISSESDSDSYDIFIYDYNLVIGETYFIKLLKDNFNNEFTSVSIPKIYDPMHENDCVYNNLLCERIINGNFSINTATINPFTSNYAFWSNDVTGWKAFWGSADLLDGLSPGNPYALMWNTFSPTGNRTGEGIVSCALIGSGIEYLLNYSIARRTDNQWTNADFFVGLTTTDQYFEDYSWNYVIPAWFPNMPAPPGPLGNGGYQVIHNNSNVPLDGVFHRYSNCFLSEDNWDRFVMYPVSTVQGNYTSVSVDNVSIIPLIPTINNQEISSLQMCPPISYSLGMSCEAEVVALNYSWISYHWEVVNNGIPQSDLTGLNQVINPTPPYPQTIDYTLIFEFIDDQGNYHVCPLGTITVEFSDIEVVADITNPLCYQLFGSIDLTPVGVPPYSYLWSTGATSQGITGLAGTYTVTITDNFPCTYVGTYLITEPPELIATVTLVTTTCTGVCDGEATILVTGGTPDYSYFITGPLGYSFTYTPTPPVPNPITLSGLCPGDYNYLIVDANGCLVEGTFTIVDGTGPIITIVNNSPPTPCASCCLGDVDITVTGGTAPYVIDISNYGTFNNIPSNISQPYTGLCPFGMYTVTVTDANGCTNIASFIYAAFPSVPWIVIDEPTECIYADDGFGVPSIATFSATEISNMDFHITQFEWDFGDGTPTVLSAPGVNVQHAFDVGSDYGYYCVSVTTHSCCAQQWTQGTTVFVHPNVCTCPNSIGYDFHTDVNIHSGTTENWTTINGADFGANLIIETGATLNLFECRLGFGPASKIIIEPGGVLNTDGTSVMPTRLTRADLIDVCYNLEYMWQGVEVWGNPDETSASPAQGRLIIQDNTIIEHAYIGVLLGARDENYICNPTWNMYDPYLSGGTIFSKDCDYEANGIAISFIEKNNRHGNNNLIMESNFLGRKIVSGSPVPLLDKRYFDGYATPYPNMQNPWAGDANFYCKGAEGISINQLEALTISSNSFDDIFRCIRAFDTGHSIRNCSFNNTKVGIEIRNSLFGVNNAHLITDNCTFDNLDPTGIPNRADGVFIEGGSFDKIENSVFGFNSIANDITVGIETMNSSDYTLVDNNLFNLSGGLFLRNTIIGASFVGNEDDLVGNIFNECRFGIFSGMTNTAVDVDCNSFIPVLTPNPFYNRNMKNNFGQFQNQGSGSDPVANLFNGSGYNKKLIRTEPTSIYVYWHFNGNQNNDPWVPTVESVFPANSGLIYNQSNACDDYIQPIMPIANNYQTIIDNLQMQYDNILANIDNGNTAELLGDIYGTMSNGQLKNKLLSNSPLSDEVLLALITEDRLSPGNYKNVMEVNLPVSDNVKPVFENYLLVLPPGIANQLAQLQAYNPGIITLTSIYQEIQHYISKRRNIVNSIINTEIFENNDINEAWQLLSGEEGLDVLRALYSKDYIEGDLISARARLEAMSAETQQQQDWITLQGILLDIKEDTLSLYELDSVQLDYFRQLAVLCDDGGLASSNARAILSYYYHEEYYCDWDPFSEPKSGKIENNNNPEQEFLNEEASLGQNYPNPFAKTTLIPYSLPDSENGVLKITNYEGKTISEINVSSKSYKVELKTKDWANGVYYYTLNIDGKTIDTKKMILIK